MLRLRSEDAIEYDRRDAHSNSRADLRHRLEQRARHALFVRERDLSDEQRPRRERKVRAEDDETRSWEAKSPVSRAWVDHCEEDVSAACHERACGDDIHDVDAADQQSDECVGDHTGCEHR